MPLPARTRIKNWPQYHLTGGDLVARLCVSRLIAGLACVLMYTRVQDEAVNDKGSIVSEKGYEIPCHAIPGTAAFQDFLNDRERHRRADQLQGLIIDLLRGPQAQAMDLETLRAYVYQVGVALHNLPEWVVCGRDLFPSEQDLLRSFAAYTHFDDGKRETVS